MKEVHRIFHDRGLIGTCFMAARSGAAGAGLSVNAPWSALAHYTDGSVRLDTDIDPAANREAIERSAQIVAAIDQYAANLQHLMCGAMASLRAAGFDPPENMVAAFLANRLETKGSA